MRNLVDEPLRCYFSKKYRLKNEAVFFLKLIEEIAAL
jgi:hypothetical protein